MKLSVRTVQIRIAFWWGNVASHSQVYPKPWILGIFSSGEVILLKKAIRPAWVGGQGLGTANSNHWSTPILGRREFSASFIFERCRTNVTAVVSLGLQQHDNSARRLTPLRRPTNFRPHNLDSKGGSLFWSNIWAVLDRRWLRYRYSQALCECSLSKITLQYYARSITLDA